MDKPVLKQTAQKVVSVLRGQIEAKEQRRLSDGEMAGLKNFALAMQTGGELAREIAHAVKQIDPKKPCEIKDARLSEALMKFFVNFSEQVMSQAQIQARHKVSILNAAKETLN